LELVVEEDVDVIHQGLEKSGAPGGAKTKVGGKRVAATEGDVAVVGAEVLL